MAENEKKKNKLVLVLIIVLVVVLAAAGIIIWQLSSKKDGDTTSLNYTSENGIGYEINAQVITSDIAATSQEDGIAVKYKTTAQSSDGWNFTGEIGNSTGNKLDMYLAIYESDENLTEQEPIYLSGLLRPGEGITQFKTTRQMHKGTYDVVLAFTLVEEDHKTLHGQSLVYLTLNVS